MPLGGQGDFRRDPAHNCHRSDVGRIGRLCPDSGGSLGGFLRQVILKESSRESSVVVLMTGASAEDPEPSPLGFRVSVQCTNSLVVPSIESAKLR